MVAAAAPSGVVVAALAVGGQAGRFSVRSDLVVLHVSVTDRSGRLVGGLPAGAFDVLEEGRPQSIAFFREQDEPATIALLIDGSGSMWKNRSLIVAGIGALAEASHRDDEFLPLLFNERLIHVLPRSSPLTGDASRVQSALTEGLGSRGLTALYDGVVATLAELDRGRYERKVLIVISDGGDNASEADFQTMLTRVLASNVLIYGVAVEDPVSLERNPEVLRTLAEATGGVAYQPRRPSAVTRALEAIASDIRGGYTLAYVPQGLSEGDIRHVAVHVDAPGRDRVSVRTRAAYVADGAAGASQDPAGPKGPERKDPE
jgi:VWFA-related protein